MASVRECVFFVLEKTDIGICSSLEALAKKVIERKPNGTYTDYTVGYNRLQQSEQASLKNVCCRYRSEWRETHTEEDIDCRTYEGQPRRDMRNDTKVKVSILGKLSPIIEQVGADTLLDTLGLFHSIDQLQQAIKHTSELSQHYDLVTTG